MPAKKRTDFASEVEDLKRRLEGLDEEIASVLKIQDRDHEVRDYDKSESDRTRRGTTRANQEAARAHSRLNGLETVIDALIARITIFAGFFRTHSEDSAKHEQQITDHERRIKGLEKVTSSNNRGSIFATWLAVVVTVVGGMLIAHNYLAERYTAFYQGKTIDIGAHPGYDAIFWAAGIIAVIATTAAAIVAAYSATPPSSVVATSSTTRTSDASTDSSAVEETYVLVDTTPTEVTPVVRV